MPAVYPQISCPKCQQPVPEVDYNTGRVAPCPACGVQLRVETFPAIAIREQVTQVGKEIVVDGEASCYYHSNKKAETHCESCGRFLCALCDIDMAGRHLCSQCIETGATKQKMPEFQTSGTQYDRLAFVFAIVSLIPFMGILAAPSSLFLSIRYWKERNSLIRKTLGWKAAAVVIASIGLLVQAIILFKVWGA